MPRPLRQRPRDFEETFVLLGWDGTPDHYGTGGRVVNRWLEECGKEELVLERTSFVKAQREVRSRERRKTYRFQ